jgi:hypothetical protein
MDSVPRGSRGRGGALPDLLHPGLSPEAYYPEILSGIACKGEIFRRLAIIRPEQTAKPPDGGRTVTSLTVLSVGKIVQVDVVIN